MHTALCKIFKCPDRNGCRRSQPHTKAVSRIKTGLETTVDVYIMHEIPYLISGKLFEARCSEKVVKEYRVYYSIVAILLYICIIV